MGVDWAESFVDAGWKSDQMALWALQMPIGPRSWAWIAAKGSQAEKSYWKWARSWASPEWTLEETKLAVARLHAIGRDWGALELVMSRQFHHQDVENEMLFGALERLLDSPSERRGGDMDVHHVREAIALLQQKAPADTEDRLARIEWGFLSILDGFSLLPKTLQRQLARDPDFFVGCIKVMFGSKEPDEDTREPDGEAGSGTKGRDEVVNEANKAQMVYRLLHDWRVIPGTNEGGEVNAEALKDWITRARAGCQKLDRLAVCDITIAELFAKSPSDKDGAVPLVVVRDVIEECASADMDSGLRTGYFNLRGSYMKGIYEGGQQERELAAKYDRYAEICSRWVRTAEVHRRLARQYRAEAEREDERAAARK